MPDELRTNPQGRSTQIDEVGRSGIYPASGPLPAGEVPVRGQGELGHPEERQRVALARRDGPPVTQALGRLLFGGYFIYNGINHFLNRQMLTEYARSKQVPMPEAAVVGSGAMIMLGGLSLLTGYQPKVGASLIAAFLLGVSPQMHDFWRVEDQQQRMQEFVNFTKNMALVGGACLAAALPEPWPASAHARGGALMVQEHSQSSAR